jgi:hypothetical protein
VSLLLHDDVPERTLAARIGLSARPLPAVEFGLGTFASLPLNRPRAQGPASGSQGQRPWRPYCLQAAEVLVVTIGWWARNRLPASELLLSAARSPA